MSFGAVADDYDRLRPGPPPEAVSSFAWHWMDPDRAVPEDRISAHEEPTTLRQAA